MELCNQLRGRCGRRQVPGAKCALQHNIGEGERERGEKSVRHQVDQNPFGHAPFPHWSLFLVTPPYKLVICPTLEQSLLTYIPVATPLFPIGPQILVPHLVTSPYPIYTAFGHASFPNWAHILPRLFTTLAPRCSRYYKPIHVHGPALFLVVSRPLFHAFALL